MKTVLEPSWFKLELEVRKKHIRQGTNGSVLCTKVNDRWAGPPAKDQRGKYA